MIELSVVVPTYNRAATLDRCLGHLAAQTLAPDRFEVIVADDASGDATSEVVGRWIAAERLDLRYRACPKGYAGATRNRGVEWATGSRIVFLGDDVLAAPDLLTNHLEAADRRGPDSIIVGEVVLDREGWTPFMAWLERAGVHHAFPQLHRKEGERLPGWYFYACNASLPTEMFRRAGGFDVSLHHAYEDGELGFRLVRAGAAMYFEPRARGVHVHPMTLARYVRFLRGGRGDVARVVRQAVAAGEPAPPLSSHRVLDRLVTDPVVDLAAAVMTAADRWAPRRLRESGYTRFVDYERRRAYTAAAAGP